MKSGSKVLCLLCGSEDYDIIHSYEKPDEYEMAVGIEKEGYFRKWVQCARCGFYYSVFSRDIGALDRIYTEAYRNECSNWRGTSAEANFRRIIALSDGESETKYRVKWIKKHIWNIWESGLLRKKPPPYRALDIGGSPGVFAYEFQDDKWKSHVIDPDENGDFIQRKFNIPFLQKKYEPNSFGFTFDLISVLFVLEHLTYPIEFLRSVGNDMESDSFLYIEVPDGICFQYRSKEDDVFNSCHLWMFTPQTLVRMLAKSGFEVYRLRRTRTIRGHYTIMMLGGKR